jgi:hypothetical protein
MKSERIAQERIQARRISSSKLTEPLRVSLSCFPVIKALRGSVQGTTSLVAALERERRKDERRKTRKRMAMDRELEAWMLKSR